MKKQTEQFLRKLIREEIDNNPSYTGKDKSGFEIERRILKLAKDYLKVNNKEEQKLVNAMAQLIGAHWKKIVIK